MSRGRCAAVLLGVVAIVGFALWIRALEQRDVLSGSWTIDGRASSWGVWVSDPGELMALLEGGAGLLGNLDAGGDRRALRVAAGARELVALGDADGLAAVELRATPWAAVALKGLGVVRGDPWLAGGRADLAGRAGSVRWVRRGGPLGLVNSQWQWLRNGVGATARDDQADGDGDDATAVDGNAEPVRSDGVGVELLGTSEWIASSGLAGGWLVSKATNGLRGARSGTAARDAGADGRRGALDAGMARLARAGVRPMLLVAEQRGESWQAMLWLETAVDVEGASVRVELPRVAVAASPDTRHRDTQRWRLPAEAAAERLQASVEEVSVGEVTVRSLSSPATEAVTLILDDLRAWSDAAPGSRRFTVWLRPAATVPWFDALPRLLVGAPTEETAIATSLQPLAESFAAEDAVILSIGEDAFELRTERPLVGGEPAR